MSVPALFGLFYSWQNEATRQHVQVNHERVHVQQDLADETSRKPSDQRLFPQLSVTETPEKPWSYSTSLQENSSCPVHQIGFGPLMRGLLEMLLAGASQAQSGHPIDNSNQAAQGTQCLIPEQIVQGCISQKHFKSRFQQRNFSIILYSIYYIVLFYSIDSFKI